jgi:hypothetical protein
MVDQSIKHESNAYLQSLMMVDKSIMIESQNDLKSIQSESDNYLQSLHQILSPNKPL